MNIIYATYNISHNSIDGKSQELAFQQAAIFKGCSSFSVDTLSENASAAAG